MFADKDQAIEAMNVMALGSVDPETLEATYDQFVFYRDRIGAVDLDLNTAAILVLIAAMPGDIKAVLGGIKETLQGELEKQRENSPPPEDSNFIEQIDWSTVPQNTELVHQDGSVLKFTQQMRHDVIMCFDPSTEQTRQVKTDTVTIKG